MFKYGEFTHRTLKWFCVLLVSFLLYLWLALRILATSRQKHSKIPIFFIISCGKSGSSVLGRMLGKHRDLCYTHEDMPWTVRWTWGTITPLSDMHIVPHPMFVPLGRLVYVASDASHLKIRVMRYLFYQKMKEENKGIMLHKFPRHIFRLPFIHKIFPETRFIFLYRNGLDVAASLERRISKSKAGVWSNNLAACQLISDAKLKEAAGSLFLRSLLYWRMNMEYGVKFFKELPKDKYMQVCYKDLCEHPEDTVKNILSFMGLDYDPEVVDFAREKIKPKRASAGERSLSEEEQLIGGKYLQASMSSPLKLDELT